MSKEKSYYYDIRDDIKKYPDAVFCFVWGGRSTGKTYSALRYVTEDKIKFAFIKRTLKDIENLVGGNSLKRKQALTDAKFDISPFAPLNRDFNWNVHPFMVKDGLGGFYQCNSNNEPGGSPLGYILSLSGASKIKGFDLSETDVMIFDEFVPLPGENRLGPNEDVSILNLYRTVMRDREHRGREPLKLFAFANADNIECPLTEAFGVVDILADMIAKNQEYYYNPDTRVLLHKLKTSEAFIAKEAQSPIYKATAGSRWANMALNNDFAFNDTSLINKQSMKNMICEARVHYNNTYHYVYYNPSTGARYITYSSHNKQPIREFDLDKVLHRKQFIAFAEHKVMSHFFGAIEPSFEKYSLFALYSDAKKKLG